jgi:hypothetical protein
MRMRGVVLAGLWTLLCGSAAGVATWRMQPLRHQSESLLASSRASADAFASSFDGQFADRQLDTFEARRAVVERVQRWQRLQLLGVVGATVGLFAGWVLWMLARLQAHLAADTSGPS